MEKREHRNREINDAGLMSVESDVACGTVKATCSGFWSQPQAIAFFKDWADVIRRTHASGFSVAAMVDMSGSGVQRAEVADLIASATVNLYRDGDAIAMLMPNCLAKIQMRRVLDARYHAFFISPSAARTWLDGRSMVLAKPVISEVA